MSINMGELRRLTDIANDPTLAEAKKKFKVGIAKDRNGNTKRRLRKHNADLLSSLSHSPYNVRYHRTH